MAKTLGFCYLSWRPTQNIWHSVAAFDQKGLLYCSPKLFIILIRCFGQQEASGLGVPRVVHSAIKHLEDKALDTEGLFRISGSAFNINSCRSGFSCFVLHSFSHNEIRLASNREALDSGVPVDLNNVDNHVVAGLLKLFFRYELCRMAIAETVTHYCFMFDRELPESVVPTALYKDFLAFAETPDPIARLQVRKRT